MPLVADKSAVFERGDHIYLVSAVAPFEPGESDIEEYSFSEHVRKIAPNENLLWLRGTYVEGGTPNTNGQEWRVEDISIKSLSPVFCPVTVMHDPRSAVGLIADTRLLTPGADNVPRARIDNTLALWKHRFPEVAEEVSENYERGTLMQSQECQPAFYDCVACGQRFPKLRGGAERAQWCEHLLAGEVSRGVTKAHRVFGNVTFTGTGLIFGTRGARGALSSAGLEVLQDEVAEFHAAALTGPVRRLGANPSRRTAVDIEQKDYEQLVAKAAKVDDLSARVTELEVSAAKVPDLEKQVETLEIAKKAADDELAAEKTKREGLEESARSVTLASERLSKLGEGFRTKLPDSVKAKLDEQAKSLTDEEWTGRLDELAALIGVKPDEGKPADGNNGSGAATFTREETSRANLGGGGSNQEPSRTAVSTVLGGLFEQNRPKRPEPAGKAGS